MVPPMHPSSWAPVSATAQRAGATDPNAGGNAPRWNQPHEGGGARGKQRAQSHVAAREPASAGRQDLKANVRSLTWLSEGFDMVQ
jgi:hypothetical protein